MSCSSSLGSSIYLSETNTGHPFPSGFIKPDQALPSLHGKHDLQQRVATVHCYHLSCDPQIWAHAKHQSHNLYMIINLIWFNLLWSIFSLDQLDTKHNWCPCQDVAIVDWVVPISKPARTIFIEPINPISIDTWFPIWSIIFHVVLVGSVNDFIKTIYIN